MEVGQKSKTKYWGTRTYKKVARLKKPVECHNLAHNLDFSTITY